MVSGQRVIGGWWSNECQIGDKGSVVKRVWNGQWPNECEMVSGYTGDKWSVLN